MFFFRDIHVRLISNASCQIIYELKKINSNIINTKTNILEIISITYSLVWFFLRYLSSIIERFQPNWIEHIFRSEYTRQVNECASKG